MARPIDRTFRRSFILGQRCATPFQREAEKLEEKNRTDHGLQKPDKLTCYLQFVGAFLPIGDIYIYRYLTFAAKEQAQCT